MAQHYHAIDEIPRTLPVFPLQGVLLLPQGHLPLNVFEPRYLAMVDTALAGPRLIGMIQPQDGEAGKSKPRLCAVGCAGRITAFKETEDGRYLITLTGICRFRIAREMEVATPYRQVQADYAPYAHDLSDIGQPDVPRSRLITALKHYLKSRELNADWSSITNAPADTLINALAMLSPFEPAEKQALLEAPGWQERVDTLIAILEMASVSGHGAKSVN